MPDLNYRRYIFLRLNILICRFFYCNMGKNNASFGFLPDRKINRCVLDYFRKKDVLLH